MLVLAEFRRFFCDVDAVGIATWLWCGGLVRQVFVCHGGLFERPGVKLSHISAIKVPV